MKEHWHPFKVETEVLIAPRGINTREGIGDRLRTAAFAEVQAELAFLWAAENLEAPVDLKTSWQWLASEERKHRDWLIGRMIELDIEIDERPVSDSLWRTLTRRETAMDFCRLMADSEERGRRAGERFGQVLLSVDPWTAKLFGRIAVEEQRHIDLSNRFFPRQGTLPAKP